MSSLSTKSFRQTRGHNNSNTTHHLTNNIKSSSSTLLNPNCNPSQAGTIFGPQSSGISSRSLLLVDTASPTLSVSDNGSISSGNESSTTNNTTATTTANNNSTSCGNNAQKSSASSSSAGGGSSNLLWLNSSDNRNNNGRLEYMTQQTSDGSNTNAFSMNHNNSPLPQRANNTQHSLNTHEYTRYQQPAHNTGPNGGGNILWPLPPINQGQVACSNDQGSHVNSASGNGSGSSMKSQMQTTSESHVVVSKSNKKESHNRIERKRRDYINTQIASLGTLLPQELYRGVDGKRNKGSVLKLSVNYIQDLRNQLARISSVQEENHLARQLIPIILQRVKYLEKTMTKLINECFITNPADPHDGSAIIKSEPGENIEKKYFMLQKLLYDAISNKFDHMTGAINNSQMNNGKFWDHFDGIENDNHQHSVLDNEIIQAWLRVFENNKSQEIYSSCNERKVDFNSHTEDHSNNGRDVNHDGNSMGKHCFPNDLRSTQGSKATRRVTRNSANNSHMSNCSSEASNTDESSPLSNLAAGSCQVEHQLFYSNQPNSSVNGTGGGGLDTSQSLLLSYSNPNQNSNTTDFNLDHLQPADILLTNSSHDANSANSNHCSGMRGVSGAGNKINDDMLCHDNPLLLSSFFTSQSYDHPNNQPGNNQSRHPTDHIQQQQQHHNQQQPGNNQYQHMLLHQQSDPDHIPSSISDSIYQNIHLRPQSTIANQQN